MKIVGGTHLGIVGCFFERELPDMAIQKVKHLLMNEYFEEKLPSKSPQKGETVKWVTEDHESGLKIYVLETKKGETVFAWHVKEETEKNE